MRNTVTPISLDHNLSEFIEVTNKEGPLFLRRYHIAAIAGSDRPDVWDNNPVAQSTVYTINGGIHDVIEDPRTIRAMLDCVSETGKDPNAFVPGL